MRLHSAEEACYNSGVETSSSYKYNIPTQAVQHQIPSTKAQEEPLSSCCLLLAAINNQNVTELTYLTSMSTTCTHTAHVETARHTAQHDAARQRYKTSHKGPSWRLCWHKDARHKQQKAALFVSQPLQRKCGQHQTHNAPHTPASMHHASPYLPPPSFIPKPTNQLTNSPATSLLPHRRAPG